jgi:UDP-3-O-[3-hydroxymyristoyl] glucosamine N-acyltransferase
VTTERTTTLGHLAQLVGGRACGDPQTVIRGAAVLHEAGEGQITLIDREDRVKQLALTKAAAVVRPETVACDWPAAIVVHDVHAAFGAIISHFRPRRLPGAVGIHPTAVVSPSARLGKGVSIHAGATVGDDCQIGDGTTILPGAHLLPGCVIGRDVLIGPGVVLYDDSIVGDRSILHGGVVVGAYGFGYSQVAGKHVLSAQLGYVRIEADVEIGAATTIDRGTYGATTIGEGTKIDNLVQIAHNCQIGRHNIICAQVGVAGSTTTGDYVVIGGQAGLRDHVHIGTGARLGAMAGIVNDVPDGVAMLGIPATPEREQKLKLAALAKLPQMRQEFKALCRTVASLQNALGGVNNPNAPKSAPQTSSHPASGASDQAA